jgi:hypothetical protein
MSLPSQGRPDLHPAGALKIIMLEAACRSPELGEPGADCRCDLAPCRHRAADLAGEPACIGQSKSKVLGRTFHRIE